MFCVQAKNEEVQPALTPVILKRCLVFTIASRLAPEWNGVGRTTSESGDSILFVQGQNFITEASKSPADAVFARVFNNGMYNFMEFSRNPILHAKF